MTAGRLADELLRALARPQPADERLAACLAAVGRQAVLAECHFYAREEPASPYHLQRTWTDGGRGSAATSVVGAASAGGALPQLDLVAEPGEAFSVVTTQVGGLYALPLRAGDLDALVLVREPGGRLGRGGRRTLLEAAEVLAVVLAQLQREAGLERRLLAATARADTSRRLQASAVALDDFLRLLIDLALSATQSEAGFVAVADERGELSIRASAGLPPGAAQLDLSPETGIFDWELATSASPLIVRDPLQAAELGVRSVLAVPLQRDEVPLGVFALLTFTRPAAFDADVLRLVSSFADQVTVMLDSSRLFAQFTDRYVTVLEGIAGAVDARRPGQVPYHALTGRLAGSIAVGVGMPLDEAASVRRAGRVHDVGLAALPTAKDAYAVDVEHPSVGAGLVGTVPVPATMVEAVECHHEWYDGWGFPRGLGGQDIPIAGRVLAVAAFAADLAVGDPLRPPWTADRIATEIRSRAGAQFDPGVVEAALPLVQSELATSDEG